MKADLIAELEREIQSDKIESLSKYFGIAPGKYGEGDVYLAIPVPTLLQQTTNYHPSGMLKYIVHILKSGREAVLPLPSDMLKFIVHILAT
jgi:hypothetical protein